MRKQVVFLEGNGITRRVGQVYSFRAEKAEQLVESGEAEFYGKKKTKKKVEKVDIKKEIEKSKED